MIFGVPSTFLSFALLAVYGDWYMKCDSIFFCYFSRSFGNCSFCIFLLLPSACGDCRSNDAWLEISFYYDSPNEVNVFCCLKLYFIESVSTCFAPVPSPPNCCAGPLFTGGGLHSWTPFFSMWALFFFALSGRSDAVQFFLCVCSIFSGLRLILMMNIQTTNAKTTVCGTLRVMSMQIVKHLMYQFGFKLLGNCMVMFGWTDAWSNMLTHVLQVMARSYKRSIQLLIWSWYQWGIIVVMLI